MAFLELIDLQKRFGATAAVHQVSLAVEQGEFVSLLGPSGCGKTTTLRMIAGFEAPTAGSIRIGGVDVTRTPANARRIGMVFQSYALFPNMTVAGNVGFGLRVARRPRAEIRARVAEMLSVIQMDAYAGRYPSQLSGGQQQRVALARALAIRPRVLLLDEPLSALDAKIRVALRAEIRAIQRRLGTTTVYVTHDQEEALSLSDRVVVMHEGRIEQVGSPFEVYNFPRTPFVASFVGTLNVLPAEVQDPGAGRAIVEGHVVTVQRGLEAARPGDRVSLALRPEQVTLIAPGQISNANGLNTLSGTVENVSFLGSVVRIEARVGSVTVSLDTFNNPHLALPAVADAVTLSFPAEACLVLNANPSRGEATPEVAQP